MKERMSERVRRKEGRSKERGMFVCLLFRPV